MAPWASFGANFRTNNPINDHTKPQPVRRLSRILQQVDRARHEDRLERPRVLLQGEQGGQRAVGAVSDLRQPVMFCDI